MVVPEAKSTTKNWVSEFNQFPVYAEPLLPAIPVNAGPVGEYKRIATYWYSGAFHVSVTGSPAAGLGFGLAVSIAPTLPGGCTSGTAGPTLTTTLATVAPEVLSTRKNVIPFVTQVPVAAEPLLPTVPVKAVPVAEFTWITRFE